MMLKKPIQIYFLCSENRCRSQIAEAFASHFGGEHVIVQSAGLDPSSNVHPFTIEVMKEVGIDISNQFSKKIEMKYFMHSNVIVKLCRKASEKCPFVPFNIRNLDWDIDDPLINGDLGTVRKVRDEIKKNVLELLEELNVPLPFREENYN